MADHVILLSIPGLRAVDIARMPNVQQLTANGDKAPLVPSFPAVTWPVQANMLTGKLPRHHGVTANGFYWRDKQEVEMWTAWNEKIQAPQIWDILHEHNAALTSAVWFPMLSKGCGADYICMPAPIHNPDGSESLWCYTKPTAMYGALRDMFGHFPLKHFWGPLANIQSSAWIADSAAYAMQQYKPNFFFIYLPHLDYAAQRSGPDSPAALKAVEELDTVIGKLIASAQTAYGSANVLWLIAGEYAITPVDHVSYPNRVLREAGLLQVRVEEGLEYLDLENSQAWALVDHQFSHVYVKNNNSQVIEQVVNLFATHAGMAEVLVGEERGKYLLDHERSGEVILISTPNSWQAYYWWLDNALAPKFARTVDIHAKPGYDPVELHFDFATKSIPLDATLIKGSHGAPAAHDFQRTVLLASQKGVFVETPTPDTDIADIVCRQFGI
jgi:predicted AlkP superfamily pyrophosphatase or phosphodiesterase